MTRRRARRKMMSALRVAWVASFVAGCGPAATLRTARTLDPGEWEIAFGGSLMNIPANRRLFSGDNYIEVQPEQALQPVLVVRHGLRDWLDVGARLSYLGLELEAGIGLKKGHFALALAPSAGMTQAGIVAQVPILAEFTLLEDHPRLLELTIGGVGRLQQELWTSAGTARGNELVLYAGGSAGLSFQPGRHFFVRVEAIYLRPVYNSAPPLNLPVVYGTWATDSLHSKVIQGTLGLGFVFF